MDPGRILHFLCVLSASFRIIGLASTILMSISLLAILKGDYKLARRLFATDDNIASGILTLVLVLLSSRMARGRSEGL